MNPVIDMDKEYGIVLEGGGAKGAYQIGAWKALREAGVKIKGIAGTSVGALNGALMCMDEFDTAQQVWENLTYSQVMDVEDEKMQRLMEREMPFWEAVGDVFKRMGEGGVDITPLKELILSVIDEDKIRQSPRELYIKTFSVDQLKELDIDLKDVEPGQMKDFLLASAYIFPLFKNEKLHGQTYIDGGAINNVPLDSLIDRGYEDIIMIRIFGIGREKRVKIPEDTRIMVIEPRVNLGDIIDFNPKKSIRNMKIGYYDAKRLIYGLKGRIYYIEENHEECYYLKQLLQINEWAKERFMEWYHIKDDEKLWTRRMVETVLPGTVMELKLSKDWTYGELYMASLEATAKLCRIPKYRVYTVEELKMAVENKMRRFSKEEKETLPVFALFFDAED
ncbi:MAG: patatin-like phospholipase family protein [Clostridia bacterium]|nr:patatin-like phospholipase family protein [Clostridia bacterium]NCC42968.1 patatin-like phospholipase family protein [Clostridia bacterium]